MTNKILPLGFYKRSTALVAAQLLGKVLHHRKNGVLTSGIIIETEAYLGIKDPACHTYQGKQTTRVQSMYLDGGHAYVYFIYGMYNCFNVVTRNEVKPEAVLIRALLPTLGKPLMVKRRGTKIENNLTSGPGKLCQALAIDKTCDGAKLNSKNLFITEGISFSHIKKHIKKSARIGIPYAGAAKSWPLRFTISASDVDLLGLMR